MLKRLVGPVPVVLALVVVGVMAAERFRKPDPASAASSEDDPILTAAGPDARCSAQNRMDTRGRSLTDDVNRMYRAEGTTDVVVRPGETRP